MPADIVKASHLPVFAPNRQGALARDVERYVVAGVRNIADMSQELPAAPEQVLFFKLHGLFVEIGPTGQARTLAVLELRLDEFVGSDQDIHGCLPILIERSFRMIH